METTHFHQSNPKLTCHCTTNKRCCCYSHSIESRKYWGRKQAWMTIDTLTDLKKSGFNIYFGNFSFLRSLTKEQHNTLRSNFLRKLAKIQNREPIKFQAVMELSETSDKTHYHFVVYSKDPITKDEIQSLLTLDRKQVTTNFHFSEPTKSISAATNYMFAANDNHRTPLVNEDSPSIIFQSQRFQVTTKQTKYQKLIKDKYGDQVKSKPYKALPWQRSITGFTPKDATDDENPEQTENVTIEVNTNQPKSHSNEICTTHPRGEIKNDQDNTSNTSRVERVFSDSINQKPINGKRVFNHTNRPDETISRVPD